MWAIVRVDDKGRILILKNLREKIRLEERTRSHQGRRGEAHVRAPQIGRRQILRDVQSGQLARRSRRFRSRGDEKMVENKIYVDINVFVYWLGGHPKLGKTAYKWIREIEGSKTRKIPDIEHNYLRNAPNNRRTDRQNPKRQGSHKRSSQLDNKPKRIINRTPKTRRPRKLTRSHAKIWTQLRRLPTSEHRHKNRSKRNNLRRQGFDKTPLKRRLL